MSLSLKTLRSQKLCLNSFNKETLRNLSILSDGLNRPRLLATLVIKKPNTQTGLCQLTPLYLAKSAYASKKGKKGKKGTKMEEEDEDEDFDEEKEVSKGKEEESEFDIDAYTPKLQACIDKLKRDFQTLRMGRANPALLDSVVVDCGEDLGGLLPLKKVGQVSIKDPQTLLINVFESKLLQSVEKAIISAGLNLNPAPENGRIKVPIPKLTAQSRADIIKQVNQMEQKAKSNIRSVRQNGMKVLSNMKKLKASGISVDEVKKLEKEVEAMVGKYTKEVDTLTASKISEIKG